MSYDDVGGMRELAFRRLEVAKEDLETARMNLKEKHYRAANNRAYYSIYHSMTAVLAFDHISYKRHKDTIGNFNKNYIKTEIFSRELGRRISKAEIVRHNSDYNEFYLVTKEETLQQIETAEFLLKEVEKYLEIKSK